MNIFSFNQKRVLVVCTLLGLTISPVNYLQAQEFDVDESVSASEEPNINEIIEDFLNSKGWYEGENTKKNGSTFFVAIGKGTIAAGRSEPGWVTSRQLAFDKAMLNAKREMLQFQEQKISTELESEYQEYGEKRQAEEVARKTREGLAFEAARDTGTGVVSEVAERSGFSSAVTASDKINGLLRFEANRQLEELGYDPSQPVDAQVLKKVSESESFKKNIQTAAQGRIVGMQAAKTFESIPANKEGQIAVVTVWSPRLQAIANAIFSNNPAIGPQGIAGKPLQQQIPRNKSALISQFGVQSKRNEKGEYCLLSYGQNAPRSEKQRAIDAAESKARITSQALIRQFAGEIGAVMETLDQAESVETYTDKMEDYSFNEDYYEKIKVSAEAIVISGMKTVKRWNASHPVTGKPIAGAVVSWCPSGAAFGQKLKADMSDAPDAQTEFSNGSGTTASGNYGSSSGEREINSDRDGSYYSGGDSADEEDF